MMAFFVMVLSGPAYAHLNKFHGYLAGWTMEGTFL